jgi:pullulanase
MANPPTNGYAFNAIGGGYSMQNIAQGSRGSIRATFSPQNTPSNPVPYLSNLGDPMFANFPSEAANYLDCHDGFCLWDAIRAWACRSHATLAYQKQIDLFAFAILMTSQGMAYFYEGDEFLRSKNQDTNLANQSDFHLGYNVIDWTLKQENLFIYNFYKKLIGLRANHPMFRMPNWDDINSNVYTYYSPQNQMQSNVLVTIINGDGIEGETWNTAIVIYNSGNNYPYTIPSVLPWGSGAGKEYQIALDMKDSVSSCNVNTAKNIYSVGDSIVCGGTSVTVLYSTN